MSSPPSFSFGSSKVKNIAHYNNTQFNAEHYNKTCLECSLNKNCRPYHCCLKDITNDITNDIDILFITDSWEDTVRLPLHLIGEDERGEVSPATKRKLLELFAQGYSSLLSKYTLDEFSNKAPKGGPIFSYQSAIKCNNVSILSDIGVKSLNLCRDYIIAEIEVIKPKFIILVGSLALKSVLKKGRPVKNVGNVFDTTFGSHECLVGVLPSIEDLSTTDLILTTHVESILKTFFIKQRDYKKVLKEKFECETLFIQENEDNSVALDIFKSIDNPIVACDIETTGLFFLSESILSISFAFLVKDKKYTLAIDAESMHDPDVEAMIRKVLCSNKFVKVFHNATFDMKFLSRDGFKVSAPIADTKLIAHLYNENTPKSLLYLTKQHLPEIL